MSSRERLNRLRTKRQSERTETLEQFAARISPGLSFRHLQPIIDLFQQAMREPVRACISVPPQHGKSTLVFHLIAYALSMQPTNVIYGTYSSDLAQTQMTEARIIADRAGIEFADRGAIRSWRTKLGGTLWADGVGGSLTGRQGGGLIFVDDPHKNWAETQSLTVRNTVYNGFKTNVMTRVHPGTSVIVVHTRWHPDDLIGRLVKDGWHYINLPAIDDNGLALWPEHRPLEFIELQKQELTDYMFASLYQGQPRPSGKEVFRDCNFYDELPKQYSLAIGIDLAYTSKKASDYSVAVVMARSGSSFYVLDTLRMQSDAPTFMARLKSLMSGYLGSRTRAYIGGGGEQGVLDLFARERVFINAIPATHDKFVRAQGLAAAWNSGRVFLPRDRAWLPAMLDEMRNFTGINDPHDDIVDAMVGAYDELLILPPDNSVEVVRKRASASFKGNW